MASAIPTAGSLYLDTQIARVRSVLSDAERMERILTGPERREPVVSIDTVAVLEDVEGAQREGRALLNDLDRMKRDLGRAANALLFLYFACAGAWFPFAYVRSSVGFELRQVIDRLQALSTEEEWAELALAESKVINEETLKVYVEQMKKIAERNDISEVMQPFDMWFKRREGG